MFNLTISELSSIRQALSEFEEYISRLCSADDTASGRLIACELVSNVLVHSECPAELSAVIAGGTLKITVESPHSCGVRAVKIPTCSQERGRGLFIVDALCESLILEDTRTIAIVRLSK